MQSEEELKSNVECAAKAFKAAIDKLKSKGAAYYERWMPPFVQFGI